MAGMFWAAQNSAIASGSEPPSRKEKAERAWSSAYFAGSVIHSFHKPLAAEKVLKNAIQANRSGVIQLQVPFIALPLAALVPPCARGAPWSSGSRHSCSSSFERNGGRTSFTHRHPGSKRRTKHPQSQLACSSRCRLRIRGEAGRQHGKAVRTVRIQRLCEPDPLPALGVFAPDDGSQAGHGDLQFHRLGSKRLK